MKSNTILKVYIASVNSMHGYNNIFLIIETELVHNSTTQIIDPISKTATLVVVSPNHGSVQYAWEVMGGDDIYSFNTGVLYVRTAGIYQCTVEGETVKFKVKGKHNEACA